MLNNLKPQNLIHGIYAKRLKILRERDHGENAYILISQNSCSVFHFLMKFNNIFRLQQIVVV